MRKIIKALLAVAVSALLAVAVPGLLLTGASTAQAAEVHCTSFSNVNVSWAGPQYFMHVPSTSWNSYNFNCVLARGDNNVGTLALQESLNACYNVAIGVDGEFGTETAGAVKFAQGQEGVAVDGRFGPITSANFQFQIYDHWSDGYPEGYCAYR